MNERRSPDTVQDYILESSDSERRNRFICDAKRHISLDQIVGGRSLDVAIQQLIGKSILLAVGNQLATALAIVQLDGVARQLVVCPPDIPPGHLSYIVKRCSIDAVISDAGTDSDIPGVALRVSAASDIIGNDEIPRDKVSTEWVLLTSGTTALPKLVVHTLATLTAFFKRSNRETRDAVWGTFYDIRRYGGLQIFLRALLGTGSFVMTDPEELPTAHLLRLAQCSATHIMGTPSHWRRVLMSKTAKNISPRYIRLSGEIADQGILNCLRSSYPGATIVHAYATTEAGVGFEVTDEMEGFPVDFVGNSGGVDLKVQESSLRLRSQGVAARYLGDNETLTDPSGFVDTGDMVERHRDRYYFLGRRNGMINVGGLRFILKRLRRTSTGTRQYKCRLYDPQEIR